MTREELGLRNERDYIVGDRNKDKYDDYRYEYRKNHGVFPELDKINNPITAPLAETYDVLCSMRKRGLFGAWFWHDVHGGFNERFTKIYEEYKLEWSFIINTNRNFDDFTNIVLNAPEGENVVNGLGYKKDPDGTYYEGTWVDGKLSYGIIYRCIGIQKLLFVGKFIDDKVSSMSGVLSVSAEGKSENVGQLKIGNIYLKKNDFEFYNGSVICMNSTSSKKREVTDVSVSTYSEGYGYGKIFGKVFTNNDIQVYLKKYKKNGECKNAIGAWGYLWRIYIGLLMTYYYMIKYTYGLLFFPIYRLIKRKNWR